MQFKLRTLFGVITIFAILVIPAFDFFKSLLETNREPDKPVVIQLPEFASTSVNTVVYVPDGETVISGGIKLWPKPPNPTTEN